MKFCKGVSSLMAMFAPIFRCGKLFENHCAKKMNHKLFVTKYIIPKRNYVASWKLHYAYVSNVSFNDDFVPWTLLLNFLDLII